jgi:hypothetical protein
MKRLALALSILALTGCSYQAILVTDDAHRFPPVSVASVRLTTLHALPAGSVIVGPIAVSRGGNADDVLGYLAELAAENGADLVVRVRLEQINNIVGASGLALRAPASPPMAPAPVPRQLPSPPVRWKGAN